MKKRNRNDNTPVSVEVVVTRLDLLTEIQHCIAEQARIRNEIAGLVNKSLQAQANLENLYRMVTNLK